MGLSSSEKAIVMGYSSVRLLKDVAGYIKPYRLRFVIGTLFRLVSDMAGLLPAFLLAQMVNFFANYVAGQSISYVWELLGIYLIAVFVRSAAMFSAKYIGYFIGETIGVDIHVQAVKHLFLLDIAWHERENAGNKIKRIHNAGAAVTKIVALWFSSCVEIIVNMLAINIIVSQFDNAVALVVCFFLVSYYILSRVLTKRAAEAAFQVNAEEENVTGVVFEAISNIRTLKVMSMQNRLLAIIKASAAKLLQTIKVRMFRYQSRNGLLSLWGACVKIGILALIAFGISQGRYELGFLVLFNGYFSNIYESINELSDLTQEFTTAKYSMARLKKMLDHPITIDNETGKVSFPQKWQKISFRNVSFAYGDNQVLKNISFDVKRGEKVGIVGLSGAGKSTVFKLLLKEREEFSGEILFDGVSIKDISKQSYFEHVSVVLQDTEVFNFSLKDNITITSTQKRTSKKLFEQAIEVAHITDLIKKLPQGLATIIGEKGVKLSGGERQRLGIARAIFKQPEILLLDEATSHLDLESEEKIRESLHAFFENVTAVVIAHRLTTIREMDTILVIEDGKLVESGSFEKLTKAKGRFNELWQKQGL